MANKYHADLTGADLHEPKGHLASHKAGGSDDLLAAPGAIGGTTPAAGSFTDIIGTGTATFNQVANADVIYINNTGTGDGLNLNQSGILAGASHGLHVHSTAILTNVGCRLVYIGSTNASSSNEAMLVEYAGTGEAIAISGSGTGTGLVVDQNGTGHGMHIEYDGVQAASKYALYVESDAAQVNSSLVFFEQDNASSTADCLEINNDGTGLGLSIQQDGVNAASKNGLWVYSNVAQVTSPLAFIEMDNAGSDQSALKIQQDGSGPAIEMNTSGQIKFPATAVPSADANTLDDYEEGTFTPTLYGETTAGSPTYVAQIGKYTKIGNCVYYLATVRISAKGGLAGNVMIGALPFTAADITYLWAAGTVSHSVGFTLTGTHSQIITRGRNNAATIQLLEGGIGDSLQITDSGVADATTISITGHYYI